MRGVVVVAGVVMLAAPFAATKNHSFVSTVVKVESVLNNNLGGVGPDKGVPEGIHIQPKIGVKMAQNKTSSSM